MSFVNRLEKIFPGFGQGTVNDTQFLNANVALSGTGQGTTTVPSTGSFSPTVTAGKMRIKIYNGIGTSPTIADILVTGTDGTTTVTVYTDHPNTAVALSTTAWYDKEFDFLVDINLTSFTVKTTLGGTSPGATLDVQVCGTI